MSVNAIDTDAALAVILGNFDTEYINHIVTDSLARRFQPFNGPMPNIVDILYRQFQVIEPNAKDYISEINEVRDQTMREILELVCQYYNIRFCGSYDEISPPELYGITRTLYDTLVSSFTNNLINVFTEYILTNADSIISYLSVDPNMKKPKETGMYDNSLYIDPKFIIIHANINQVIANMASYDIDMDELFRYLFDPNTTVRMLQLFQDCGDIYKNHFASYIVNPQTSAGVITNVKLNLQSLIRVKTDIQSVTKTS